MKRNDEISKGLKKDKYQGIFNALASVSHQGSHPVSRSYFISRVIKKIFHDRERSMDKVVSALNFYEANKLVEIREDENRIIVNKDSAIKYASEKLVSF